MCGALVARPSHRTHLWCLCRQTSESLVPSRRTSCGWFPAQSPISRILTVNVKRVNRKFTDTVKRGKSPCSHGLARFNDIGSTPGTGRRLSAWCSRCREDVLFDDGPTGSNRWRAEFDPRGYEQAMPMSLTVRDTLLKARVDQGAIGKSPVFPAPGNPAEPCRRDLLDKWLRRAYMLAGSQTARGSLWHALRRKWVTERKDYSIKDIGVADGRTKERCRGATCRATPKRFGTSS